VLGCINSRYGGRRVRAAGRQDSLCSQATLLALAVVLVRVASAQVVPSPGNSVLSHSGQFIIHAQRSAQSFTTTSTLATNRNLVRLEPALAGISCERIKQALWRELGTTAPWRGRIYLEVGPARAAGQTITITSERFKNGWQYQVQLPELVERDRYTRALVHVLLLEFANRGSRGRLAEIPLWFTEGFSQRLLASREIEIILPPPRETVNGLPYTATRVTERMDDPVAQARRQLRGNAPATFDQLSWQAEEELSGAAAEVYRASAQLFVSELLRLPDGRACLNTMLARLPQYYNWQLAFLDAFRSRFERPLDVEKWWALCCVQAPEQERVKDRPAQLTWDNLDRALHAPALARTGATTQGTRAEVSLQTMIREWDRTQQILTLPGKLQELSQFRSRVTPDLAVLVQEYCQAIEVYLQNQRWTRSRTLFGARPGLTRVAGETVQRLDALDARRETLRPPKARLAAGEEIIGQPAAPP
jgi:hypothetical protein